MFSVSPAEIITIAAVALLVSLFAGATMAAVDWRTPARGRRWAVPATVTIGAVVTPSGGPLTLLLLLSVPLYVLYELDIWVIRPLIRR